MLWISIEHSAKCFCKQRNLILYIYIYIGFRFTSKNHNSLFHPYRNHQVVIPIRPPDDSYTDETDCCGFFEVKLKTILRSIYMVFVFRKPKT